MKLVKTTCDQQSCFLCKRCLKEWIPAIEANKKSYQFKKGEIIFHEGEPVTGIYFLYDGKAKVHKKWGEEKELNIRFARKGDIIGHRGLGKETTYPVSATALETCTVCFIDLAFFKTTLKVNTDFTYDLLMFYAEELQESEKRMRNLAHMPVKGRIAYAFLILKEKFGLTPEGFINISLTRQDIASYAGTTYETVFRIVTELTQSNIITIDNKDITILDEEALRRIMQEAENGA
ncbi:Crp/Fnr family transcriptional regulator [Paraflavitalea sp. CAU 1676]|uniref:Crp/Fnr family transcriptional regulator n=1 Tax=Paraflavitalea sp. CAU 1676 TaxID=3032598 RepID=UPI0023DC5A5B|nr:Crp/Fnr family transcriptional regulator [Paraflavitalea sp. CAU 1676]MDF2188062.1 Crp/Fnr family transcriptional regulator [Paraflavitalea sp. CAU 1676]